jgi:transposase
LRGQRCHDTKKAKRTTRYNIIAALHLNILIAPFVFEGYSNRATYETYLKKVLIPALRPGMVLVLDNVSFHKSPAITQLIEDAHCRIIYLPPYSPDFNPIEHWWTPLKNNIRYAARATKDFYQTTINVIQKACGA